MSDNPRVLLWLLRRFMLRRMRSDRLRTIFLLLVVALATAVFQAVFAASGESLRSFERAVNVLGGEGRLELRAVDGRLRRERVAPLARQLSDRFAVLPVRTYPVTLAANEGPPLRLSLVATDLLELSTITAAASTPRTTRVAGRPAILVPEALRSRLALNENGQAALSVYDQRLALAPSFFPGALGGSATQDAVFIGMAELSGLVDTGDTIDAVVLVPRNEAKLGGAAPLDRAAIDRALEREGLILVTGEERRAKARRLFAAFEMNIFVMVSLTLIVCAFAVFNSSQLTVLRLRNELSILATLGVRPRTAFSMILGEAACLGALGAALGAVLGSPLVRAVEHLFLQSVSVLYGGSGEAHTTITPALLLLSIVAGIVVCVLGALYPALGALGVRPTVSSRSAADFLPFPTRRAVVVSLVAAAGSALAVGAALAIRAPLLAHLGSGLLLLSAVALGAAALDRITSLLHRLLRASPRAASLIAFSNVLGSLRPAAVTVAASTTAVTLLVGLAVMITSFRVSLEHWMGHALQADLFVRSSVPDTALRTSALSAAVEHRLMSVPSVERVSRFSSVEGQVNGVEMTIAGADIDPGREVNRYQLLSGSIDAGALGDGRAVLLSESAAARLGVGSGDTVTALGARRSVAAVYRDFANERGIVLFDLEAFRRLAPQAMLRSVALYLKAGADPRAVRAQLLETFADQAVDVSLNGELRAIVLRIFDRTFQITEVMRALMVILCAIGFAASALQIQWERKREIRTLEVLGTPRWVLRRSVLIEGLLLALPSILVGSACGALLAFVLIDVINPLSFGWSLEHVFTVRDFAVPALAIGLALLVPAALMSFVLGHVGSGATLSDE